MELAREIVIFLFAIYMTLWAGYKALVEIKGDTKAWKVVLWVLFLVFNVWTWLSQIEGWADEELVNSNVPLSLFPFYNGVLQGAIDFITALWDWLTSR